LTATFAPEWDTLACVHSSSSSSRAGRRVGKQDVSASAHTLSVVCSKQSTPCHCKLC
jgi:hypothetical protein